MVIVEDFKLKVKELSNDELHNELCYYNYKYILAYITVEESIEKRKFSYITLQDIWLKTKDINSKRYVSIKEFIKLFTKQINGYLTHVKEYKLRLKIIKDEISLRNNGKAKS
jgi:hypothetical protein